MGIYKMYPGCIIARVRHKAIVSQKKKTNKQTSSQLSLRARVLLLIIIGHLGHHAADKSLVSAPVLVQDLPYGGLWDWGNSRSESA